MRGYVVDCVADIRGQGGILSRDEKPRQRSRQHNPDENFAALGLRLDVGTGMRGGWSVKWGEAGVKEGGGYRRLAARGIRPGEADAMCRDDPACALLISYGGCANFVVPV